MAVTLVGTLMVPQAAAFASPADQEMAEAHAEWVDAAQTALAEAGADSDGASSADAAAASDEAVASTDADASGFTVDQLLAPMSGEQDAADADADGTDGDDVDANGLLPDGIDPSEKVTIIVQLEEGGNQGVTLFSTLLGRAAQDRHSYFKDRIREAAGDLTGQDEDQGGLQLFSLSEADDSVQELRDYYNVIDGFAVKAPAGTLEAIKAMDGVKNAFLSEEHEIPVDEGDQGTVQNQSSLDMTGADQVEETGKGQTVVIIDSGVATAHEAFSGDLDDGSVALTQSDVSSLQGKMSAGGQHGAYVSEKIPFAYDYADYDAEVTPSSSDLEHGTHVAGIAAANAGEIRGTAPDAQIIAMKVASDATGSIPDDAILAALDDAAVLDPDAINMSLGTDGGFSADASNTFADALNVLEAQGVTLNVAAGNAYSAAYANQSGSNLPYADDPDSGIVSAPSALTSSVSVASVNNAQPKSAFKAADGTVIGYDLMRIQRDGVDTGETSPDLSTIEDGSYEYVDFGAGTYAETDAWGAANNYDLTGKIALVQRGPDPATGEQVSFTDKVNNILAAGGMGWPSAIIVYNNVPGDLNTAAVSDMDLYLPVVCISQEAGEALKNAVDKHVTVQAGLVAETPTDYIMSSFSSWGVTPDLQLKPEVTAPGGNIYSSVLDGQYAYMSGTSMAAPQMTGISAQMHEYVESDAKFSGMSDSEKSDVITQLLMSTAEPIADSTVENSYYSPRKQGAGLANVPAATGSDVFATVEGATDASRPKADLGESADGTWSFTVTLHNLGSADHTFAPDAAALSEQVADGLFQQHSANWAGEGIDVSFSADEVTVPAGGTASVTVSIAAGEAFAAWAAENTPMGTFVDGFAMFTAVDEDGWDLSVPFLGFYGDWSADNAFDAQLTDGAATADNPDGWRIYGTANADPNGLPLGLNLLDSEAYDLAMAGDYSKADPNKMVVSNMGYDSAPSQLLPLTGLLRGVDNLTYTYKNDKGEAVRTYSHDYVTKSYYYASAGYVLPADSRIGYYSAFNGKGDNGQRLADGVYTLERTATTSGPDSEVQTDDVATFWYDTHGPQISNIEYAGAGDEATISFDVTDDSWLAAFDFHDPDTGGYFYRVNPTDADTPTENADGSRTWHFTVKVADIKAAWDATNEQIGATTPCPNEVPLYAWDYGLNPSDPVTAVVTPVAAESIVLDSTEVALAPRQVTGLTATVLPESSTEKNLTWTSSDESIVTVDQDGTLTGVREGSATVTVASVLNPEVKAVATVTVAPVSEEVGIVMSRATARVEPDGTVEVTAILAPSLEDAAVTWTSSDSSIASVQADPDDPTKATVTGGIAIGDAQITAAVEGKQAQMTVEVRPANYDDFVIEDDGTLFAYAGNSSYVEIPNNVTRIGDRAFMSTPVQEVHVPASVESIGYQAFANCAKLETVVFDETKDLPSQLTEIGEQAFYTTLKFDEITLPDSVTTLGSQVFANSAIKVVNLGGGVREIPESAFAADAQLYSVTMSDKVTSIGKNAFSTCVSMSGIDLIDTADGAAATGLPSALRTIGSSAFSGSAFGGTVAMPAGLQSIGDGAFSLTDLTGVGLNEGLTHLGAAFGGTSITEVTVPSTVTSVGSGVFSNMGSLVQVDIKSTEIPDGALIGGFMGDTALQEISVPEDAKHYTVVDDILFNKDETTLVAYKNGVTGAYAVPEGVATVADYAFYQGNTTEVTFPESLRTIGQYAFCESDLTGAIELPANIENIGHGSFMNLSISSVDIGGAVTIGGSAFYSCPQLTDVELGGGVAEDEADDLNRLVSIGSNAFGMSDAIRAIIMPDSLMTVGDGAFANIAALEQVHIGAGLTGDISGFVTGASNLSKLTVSPKNPVYSAEQNVLYGIQDYPDGATDSYGDPLLDGLHLVLSLPTNTFEEYTVKPGTVQIDNQAFRDNTSLKKVTLPEGLVRLSTGSFNNCSSLAEMNFPSTLQYVNGLSSTALSVVDLPAGLVELSDSAFAGNIPDHLIMRGMSSEGNGAYISSDDYTGDPNTSLTMYFGPGVTTIDSGITPLAKTVVLPDTLTQFAPDYHMEVDGGYDREPSAEATAAYLDESYIYVPAGNAEVRELATSTMRDLLEGYTTNDMAWWGVLPADYDVDGWLETHIKDYTALGVNLSTAEPIQAGVATDVTATVVGGVDGAKQVRFVQPNADGTETVLTDWADAAAGADGTLSATLKAWTPTADALAPRAEVRDATYLTAEGSLGFDVLPETNFDLGGGQVTVKQGEAGPTFTVEATAVEGVTVAYQWLCDGEPIEGATAASFTVPTDKAGTHVYQVRVTFTNTATGAVTAVSSAPATVTVQEPPVVVDTTAAQAAIAEAEKLVQADYTEGSWAVFAAALESAKAAVANPTSQTAVDAATAALKSAQAALVKVSETPVDPDPEPTDPAAPGDGSGNGQGAGNGGAADKGGTASGAKALAKTGDEAPMAAVAATGLLGGALAAAAAFFSRKKKRG